MNDDSKNTRIQFPFESPAPRLQYVQHVEISDRSLLALAGADHGDGHGGEATE